MSNSQSYNQSYYARNRDAIIARQKIWQRANKEKRKRHVRNCTLKKKYGITLDQYEETLQTQDYKCAVCRLGTDTCVQKALSVDHNHETGKVRGLLCDRCNRALGLLKDNKGNMLIRLRPKGARC